jgi:chromosome segregation ATPase
MLTLGLLLVGCASQRAQPRLSYDAHLHSLLETREKLVAQVAELEMALVKLQDQHPDPDGMRDAARQDLQHLSQAYVTSQLERIEAESKYGPGHPVVRAAQKKEESMHSLYQQKLKHLSESDQRVRERDRLAQQLRDARESLRRLDDRIAHLEDRAMT